MTKKHHIWIEDEKQRKGKHEWKELGMAEDKVGEVAIERMVNEEECHKKMEGMMAMVNKEESQRNIEQEVSSELTSMGKDVGMKESVREARVVALVMEENAEKGEESSDYQWHERFTREARLKQKKSMSDAKIEQKKSHEAQVMENRV